MSPAFMSRHNFSLTVLTPETYSRSPMLTTITTHPNERTEHHVVHDAEQPVSAQNALRRLRDDPEFRTFMTKTLNASPFQAIRWEVPVLHANNLDQPFQFVIIQAPELKGRTPNPHTFANYFSDDGQGIAIFTNLGGDSTLIAPSPREQHDIYGHFAPFIQHAPHQQIHALWQAVGEEALTSAQHGPTYLSTAGGGVAWLHVRLDPRPKYYHHTPYRNSPRETEERF